jgi:hypothetical protein
MYNFIEKNIVLKKPCSCINRLEKMTGETELVEAILLSVFQKPLTSGIGGRLKRELLDMIKLSICNVETISFAGEIDPIHREHFYRLTFCHNKDQRWYEFRLSSLYPFREPRLWLNGQPYESFLRMNSVAFKQALLKYTSNYCLCCKSILNTNNWAPVYKLKDVAKEVHDFYQVCRRVADNVIVNVIKRKYLIDDINLIEWIY